MSSKMILFLGILWTITATQAIAAVDYSVCPELNSIPEGEYDPAITLKKVMNQLQDHLNAAEGIALNGLLGSSSTPPDLAAAIDHTESARNCALVTARNAKVTMRPFRTDSLPLDQQAAFLEKFAQDMLHFSELLAHYRSLFEAQAALPQAERDYRDVYHYSMEFESFANTAHHYFN